MLLLFQRIIVPPSSGTMTSDCHPELRTLLILQKTLSMIVRFTTSSLHAQFPRSSSASYQLYSTSQQRASRSIHTATTAARSNRNHEQRFRLGNNINRSVNAQYATQKRSKSNVVESSQNPLSGLWKPTHLHRLYYGSGSVERHLLECLPSETSKAFIVRIKRESQDSLVRYLSFRQLGIAFIDEVYPLISRQCLDSYFNEELLTCNPYNIDHWIVTCEQDILDKAGRRAVGIEARCYLLEDWPACTH